MSSSVWGRESTWFVTITDHELAPVFAKSLESEGRYVFAPLGFINVGGTVRMRGDGPASWTRWIVVARPRTLEFAGWGALRGGYWGSSDRGASGGNGGVVPGAKPLWLMRALVRDYSRPGDLVVDPTAGGGTTLLAARIEGRNALGAEIDGETHAHALKRLSEPYTPDLFADTSNARRGGLTDIYDAARRARDASWEVLRAIARPGEPIRPNANVPADAVSAHFRLEQRVAELRSAVGVHPTADRFAEDFPADREDAPPLSPETIDSILRAGGHG